MNSVEKNLTTKVKILQAANELFAQKELGETSVREIASLADVNLAAINYHFTNKDNLYWEVFKYNHMRLDTEIKALGAKAVTTEDLVVSVFNVFVKDRSAIMNTFKILLSDKVIDSAIKGGVEAENFGPPGEAEFLSKIQGDLDGKVSLNGQMWAMKVTFSLLVHFGVMVNTTFIRNNCDCKSDFKPEIMEQALRHAVRANLKYLSDNPDVF